MSNIRDFGQSSSFSGEKPLEETKLSVDQSNSQNNNKLVAQVTWQGKTYNISLEVKKSVRQGQSIDQIFNKMLPDIEEIFKTFEIDQSTKQFLLSSYKTDKGHRLEAEHIKGEQQPKKYELITDDNFQESSIKEPAKKLMLSIAKKVYLIATKRFEIKIKKKTNNIGNSLKSLNNKTPLFRKKPPSSLDGYQTISNGFSKKFNKEAKGLLQKINNVLSSHSSNPKQKEKAKRQKKLLELAFKAKEDYLSKSLKSKSITMDGYTVYIEEENGALTFLISNRNNTVIKRGQVKEKLEKVIFKNGQFFIEEIPIELKALAEETQKDVEKDLKEIKELIQARISSLKEDQKYWQEKISQITTEGFPDSLDQYTKEQLQTKLEKLNFEYEKAFVVDQINNLTEVLESFKDIENKTQEELQNFRKKILSNPFVISSQKVSEVEKLKKHLIKKIQQSDLSGSATFREKSVEKISTVATSILKGKSKQVYFRGHNFIVSKSQTGKVDVRWVAKDLAEGTFGEVFKIYNLTKGNYEAQKIAKGQGAVEDLNNEIKILETLYKGYRGNKILGLPEQFKKVDVSTIRGKNIKAGYIAPLYNLGDLESRMKDVAKLPEKAKVCRIIYPLLYALAYGHQKGVHYKDIKPENILLKGNFATEKQDTPNLEVVMTDFGSSIPFEEMDVGICAAGSTYVFVPNGMKGLVEPKIAQLDAMIKIIDYKLEKALEENKSTQEEEVQTEEVLSSTNKIFTEILDLQKRIKEFDQKKINTQSLDESQSLSSSSDASEEISATMIIDESASEEEEEEVVVEQGEVNVEELKNQKIKLEEQLKALKEKFINDRYKQDIFGMGTSLWMVLSNKGDEIIKNDNNTYSDYIDLIDQLNKAIPNRGNLFYESFLYGKNQYIPPMTEKDKEDLISQNIPKEVADIIYQMTHFDEIENPKTFAKEALKQVSSYIQNNYKDFSLAELPQAEG